MVGLMLDARASKPSSTKIELAVIHASAPTTVPDAVEIM